MVERNRIARLLGQHPERFLERCFRPHDVALAEPDAPEFAAGVAGSWAVKEAFLKALGGDPRAIPYRDVVLVSDSGGSLSLELYGLAEEMGRAAGVGSIRVSISRTSAAATAVVILER